MMQVRPHGNDDICMLLEGFVAVVDWNYHKQKLGEIRRETP